MRTIQQSRRRSEGDEGVVLVIVALSVVAILVMVAIVIDLNSGRNDRQSERLVADSASTAAALELLNSGAVNACEVAKGYVIDNVDAITSLSGIDCSAFSGTCVAATAREQSDVVGDYTVTFVHPVPDDHRFMDTSTIGSGTQTVVPDDGEPCARFGVELAINRATNFAAIAGQDRLPTRVHSVAISEEPIDADSPLNLLILERRDCQAATASGGGSDNGGIIVEHVANPGEDGVFGTADDVGPDGIAGTADDLRDPGVFAIDSDGTGADCGEGTMYINGNPARLRADGPPGCATEVTPGTGDGCGLIQTFASGPPGCNMPACSKTPPSHPYPIPSPERLPQRLTRAPIDHRFDCKASYASASWSGEQPIGACGDAGARPAYITDLVNFAGGTGAPIGFQRYEFGLDGVLGGGDDRPCPIGPSDTVVVPEGNYYVGCSDLDVRGTLFFAGGNVIFEGDVTLGAQGNLTLNACADTNSCLSPVLSWIADADFVETQYSNDAGWAYFRDGTLGKAGGASLQIYDTMVYFSSSSTIDMGGGSGGLTWIAPFAGPFEDLALWSEGTDTHNFAGQANLTMEGVFFVPIATVDYTGNGGQKTVSAQFLAQKVAAGGNGVLVVSPKFGRLVEFPTSPISQLIR